MAGRRKVRSRNVNYHYQGAQYNYSSVAYDVQPVYYPEELPLPMREPQRDRQLERELKAEKHNSVIHRMKLIGVIAVVFAGCLLTMSTYASVAEKNLELSELRDELALAKSANVTLEAEMVEEVDLAQVEKIATEELGMAKPQAYQIKYIDVPQQSYTVQYDVDSQENTPSFQLSDIKDMFKKE